MCSCSESHLRCIASGGVFLVRHSANGSEYVVIVAQQGGSGIEYWGRKLGDIMQRVYAAYLQVSCTRRLFGLEYFRQNCHHLVHFTRQHRPLSCASSRASRGTCAPARCYNVCPSKTPRSTSSVQPPHTHCRHFILYVVLQVGYNVMHDTRGYNAILL